MRYWISYTFLFLFVPQVYGQCYRLVWADEFEGTELDTTAWSYQTGDGCPSLCGWGNAEAQWYRQENVEVSGGTLKIHIREESFGPSSYTSARIRTFEKLHWTTGRFEARMKMPIGQGLWPAFWMLPEETHYGTWPMSGEIDIMEMIGGLPSSVFGTLHYGPAFPANQYEGEMYSIALGTLADNFHVYAIEWEEDEIRWYFDDVLYSTLTAADLAPYPWRFDRDFHLILNAAVGGFFPGYPDASTVFPQVLEVDYIRVYQDVEKTLISGPKWVLPGSQNAPYYIQPLEGATYNWSVPEGANIISGQGTTQALVNWGESGGSVEVEFSSPTCTASISKSATMPGLNCSETLLDFESTGLISWISSDGVYEDSEPNPAPNEINSSATAARYERNPAVTFNVLRYTADAFNDAALFKSGELVLELDVYTSAPAGALISLQLENMQLATQPYPSGRNSVYQAATSQSNAWHTLRFPLILTPDGSLANNRINQFLILFQPGTASDAVFWFDNLRITDADCETTGLQELVQAQSAQVWPNPFNQQLHWSGSHPADRAELHDASGRLIMQLAVQGSEAQWSLGELPPGMYWLRVHTQAGWITQSLVKTQSQ